MAGGGAAPPLLLRGHCHCPVPRRSRSAPSRCEGGTRAAPGGHDASARVIYLHASCSRVPAVAQPVPARAGTPSHQMPRPTTSGHTRVTVWHSMHGASALGPPFPTGQKRRSALVFAGRKPRNPFGTALLAGGISGRQQPRSSKALAQVFARGRFTVRGPGGPTPKTKASEALRGSCHAKISSDLEGGVSRR